MRKIVIGLGLLAVSKMMSRRRPQGFWSSFSLYSLAGTLAANAAAELLPKRTPAAPAKAPPPAAPVAAA